MDRTPAVDAELARLLSIADARDVAASDAETSASGADGDGALYLREVANRARAAHDAVRALVESAPSSSSKPRGPLAIPRVRCETLSLARFRRDFVIPQRPVIIVGLGPHLTSDGANASDLRWLRKHGASKKVAVSVDNAHVASTLSCGGVEIVNLGDHLDVVSALDEDPPVNERDARFGKRRGDGSYLYDCAIPLKLPSLSHGVRVPRYFAHDFLQRTRMTHAFSASWPSLFVAAPHTRSSLHVDQWKGNFWMAMVKGTKRWTLFHREDIPFLSPDYGRGTLDPGFPSLVELDASRVSAANAATTTTRRGDGIGDSQKLDADAAASSARETETTHETPASHPFLEYARRWDCDLGPGEVLFVPGGWPHHVHNLCVTVSFAGNFVDEVRSIHWSPYDRVGVVNAVP
jgi:solute carrier family 25 thiamine pyrophosphate transporter 19|eukprot:29891-Pelagococcus_subviridis.AAC.10